MTCPALQINNLSLELASVGRKIIDDVSFTVPGGTTVALVGESGSGKTMTSMAVMGLLPPGIRRVGGTITVDHQPTEDLSAEQYRDLRHRKVAMVMQNPMSAFDPVLSISYHFWETLSSHGIGDKAEVKRLALEALAEVGFDDPARILELYPFQMSGGMLQRVMLALALMLRPPLIIADEATTDLDVLSQARILKLLKTHCRKHHLALLLITHDLSVAAGLADEMVVLKEGRLMERGPVERVFKSPQSPYTAELVSIHRGLYTPRYQRIMNNLAGGAR